MADSKAREVSRFGRGDGLSWVARHLAVVLGLVVACSASPVRAEDSLAQRGWEAHQRGDFRAAATLLEAAIEELSRRSGEGHADTLQAMQWLVDSYAELGEAGRALPIIERVVQLRQQTLGPRHPDTLGAMNDMALIYAALGRRAEWLRLAEQVLQARTEVLGERHSDTLETMASVAGALGAAGRDAERLAMNRKLLALCIEGLGSSHPMTITVMNNLASTLADMGQLTESLDLSAEVIRLRTGLFGERHPKTLDALSNHGDTLGLLGRFAERLELDQRALRLRTEVLGARHPDVLLSMSNLAHAHQVLGHYAESLALSERALALRTEVLGPRHPETLVSSANLAHVLGLLGRHDEQLVLSERNLRMFVEVYGEKHMNTLVAMSNLAESYGERGRHEERAAMNERALRLKIEALGERHPSTLLSYSNLARSQRALGRLDDSLALHEKTWRLRREVLGERHPDTLASMRFLAEVQGDRGRWDEALALNEAALPLVAQALGERHPTTLQVVLSAALSYEATGRFRDAAALSSRYVVGAEGQRAQPGLTSEYRQSLFRRYADGYRSFALLHGQLDDVAEAFRLTELGKARTLLETMAAQHAARAGVLPAADSEQLEALNRRIGTLNQRLPQAASDAARQALESERNDLAREHEALQSRLRAQYPKFAQLGDVTLLGANDLAGLVPSGAVAVSYLLSGYRLAALIVDPAGTLRHVALGAAPHLADAIEIWRRAHSRDRSPTAPLSAEGVRAWRLASGGYRLLPAAAPAPEAAVEVQDLTEVGRYLGRLLLQPLAAGLQGRTHWIVSPDGPLAQLPFEALPFGDAGAPAVAAAEIHYTQSLSVYALSRQLQQKYSALPERRGLMAMGNPIYEARPSQALSPGDGERRALVRNTPLRVTQQLRDLDSLWQNLPGTEAEVKAVAKLFPGSASVYLGDQATEQQLQALNARGELKNYRYLLLSAHGYLSAEQPALSSIVLGLKDRTPEADGYVTAAEWPAYDLKSELAVLSACDSGVGKVVSGEGVMGLPFAMFVAGNVNTILSLWPVDDRATAEFVTRLFEHLQAGRSSAQALAATKREFARHRRWSHPAYWAPFVLVGAG